MHVSAVSEPHAYLPVGIIHRRPTADPVSRVRSRQSQATGADTGDAPADDAGPKLLLDLALIAPRQTDEPRVAAAAESSAAGRSEECATCARREYKDRSDDSSVSFQTPTHLSPAEAEVMVRVHEQEHVQHERMKAEREGKEVDTRVSVHYSICPECGRVYCSGGTTRVATREPAQPPTDQPGAAAGPDASPQALPLDLVA